MMRRRALAGSGLERTGLAHHNIHRRVLRPANLHESAYTSRVQEAAKSEPSVRRSSAWSPVECAGVRASPATYPPSGDQDLHDVRVDAEVFLDLRSHPEGIRRVVLEPGDGDAV